MSRFVAVSDFGEVRIHMPDAGFGYATLCGLDGDDPDPAVQQHMAAVPAGAKINCPACLSIWERAKQYRAKDFEVKP